MFVLVVKNKLSCVVVMQLSSVLSPVEANNGLDVVGAPRFPCVLVWAFVLVVTSVEISAGVFTFVVW